MKRKKFILAVLSATSPLLAFTRVKTKEDVVSVPFKVDAGKSRFGDVVKFLGVHPNDLKISSKDTAGQFAAFEYTGLGKAGPALHVHFHQDEIFFILEGEYHFVVGDQSQLLKAGDTIFLPRNIPHTWFQKSDKGKMIYLVQPALKMEEFFIYMNTLKTKPSDEDFQRIHRQYDMEVVGPPLTE